MRDPNLTSALEVSIRRPFPVEYAAKLWGWLNMPRDPNFDDYGPDRAQFEAQLVARIAQERTWGIWSGQQLVGYLGFIVQTPVCGQFRGLVIAPRYRRQGIGLKAVRVAIAELTQEHHVEKFIVWTFADNHRILQLFRQLGFRQEGYITGATRRAGQPLDMRVLCLPGREGA